MMRTLQALLLLLTFQLVVNSRSMAEVPVVKVGWIGPLTGDAAFLGVDSVAVAKRELAKAGDFGLRKASIELIVSDDQYETAKAVKAYQKLVHVDGVKIIFILSYGGTIALAAQAERDNVLLINPLDCDEELAGLPRNIMCVAKRTEDLGIINGKHALSAGNHPAAIIYFNADPFEPKVAKSTKETLEQGGAKVVLFEGLSQKIGDFRTLLTKAKSRGAKSIFFYGYDDFGSGLKQARELGISSVFYGLVSIKSPGFLGLAGDAVNGMITSGWSAPRTPEYFKFIDEHTKELGRGPLLEVATIPTFDIAHLIIEGLKGAVQDDGKVSIDTLRSFIYATKDYQGLSGSISMDPDGAVRSLKVGIYRFINGDFADIER